MNFVFSSLYRKTKNINVAFQNEAPLQKGIYKIKLAARNTYRVFLNDVLIHYGPSRSAHGYLQEDQLLIHADRIKNYITIEVVGHNINSYYFVDEEPLFGIEIYLNEQLLLHTNNFQCYLLNDRTTKIQRYSFQRDFAESYVQKVDRSIFYLGNHNMFPRLDVMSCEAPKVIARQTPYPDLTHIETLSSVESGQFILDTTLPIWTDRAIENISETFKGYEKQEFDIRLSDDISRIVYQSSEGYLCKSLSNYQYQIYDATRTLTGFIKLSLTVLEHTIFYVTFDEVDYKESSRKHTDGIHIDFSRNSCSNILRYELAAGQYEIISFEPYSLRYLNMIVFDGKLDVSSVQFVRYENQEIYKLSVQTADEDINNIVKASQHTLAQNAVDVLTDCPSRERAGWLCDAWFSARAEQLMTGHNTIEQNFLWNYAVSPQSEYLPKGMIPMNYPADHTDGIFIPNWSLWYGIELYDYFLRTSDEKLVKESRSKIEGLIQYFKAFENSIGLLEDLESWVFIEWSKANEFISGVNIPSNMIYAHFFECVGKLYHESSYLDKALQIKHTIRQVSFNGTFFEDQLIRDEHQALKQTHHISETCQYYAFFTGVATNKTHKHLFNMLINEFGYHRDEKNVHPNVYKSNAFIGNYLRLEMLRRHYKTEQLLKECKDYFLYMANRTGTLWEHSYVYGSLNHGFASYAANLIVSSLTGLSGYNAKQRTIKYQNPTIKLDFDIIIPFGEGIRVHQKDGNITYRIPEDIEVVKD